MSLEYTSIRGAELVTNANAIKQEVERLSNGNANLVCVSKLKPASDIKALYDVGYRHFGENYVQELIEKAKVLPKDIKWHFIGGLQTNKCKDLSKNIENLYVVETIDTVKKAKKLNDTRKQMIDEKTTGFGKVGVCVQVNTSGEEQKSGCEPGTDLDELVRVIIEECDCLEFHGLMTIGSYAVSHGEGENAEFKLLAELKDHLQEKFRFTGLQLSMGMSGDYAQAIRQGSTSVRVGSSIFGSRPPNNGH
jgi:pyridoxal phosphate enzyme (YggS family)